MYPSFSQPPKSFEDPEYEQLIRDGINAAKGGNKSLARRLLERAATINSADVRIWLWLSSITDDLEEQHTYLERAVAADPSNAAARRGLMMLSDKLDKSRLVPEGDSVPPRQPTQPEKGQAQLYQCPKCGGHLAFDASKQELICQYCGYIQTTKKRLAPDAAEQAIDWVLPTTRAHRWAEAQQRVACEACGAITLLPSGQTADRCPYCGSNRFVRSAEAAELVDPQVVALFRTDAQQVAKKVKEWFGKGLTVPDDLIDRAGALQLKPAYYPFWTFDGTLEIPWTCEVNEGTNKYPRWVPRNGTEFELFDDVVVPGLRSMPETELSGVEPFNLKDLVEFSPDYMAGWVSLTYDYPLSDASLRAREKVIKKFNRFMYANIEPGREKRNLRTGGGKWSGMTFKHVLLPLWIGAYHYQDKLYRVLVNGQTGKVGGSKPTDTVKAATLGIGTTLIVIIVIAILILLWMKFAR
jgi:DNA-directed RNA polymerase subunit RPC12/RpoP